MLNFENDRVGPSQGMWPLLCHEINLSFDQEERVRTYQRQLLSNPESWIERHLGTAAMQMIQSLHNAILGLMEVSHQRESKVFQCLSKEQQVKFLRWSLLKRNAWKQGFQRESSSNVIKLHPPSHQTYYEVDQTRHDAVNLYVLNHKFSKIAETFPRREILFDVSVSFKKLGRRPTFESLGNSTSTDDIGVGDSNMTTCSSSSSLKRCSSEMSCDDLESVQPLSDGMGFKRTTSSHRFHMDDVPVPVTVSSSSSILIHTTPEAAQAAASGMLMNVLEPIRVIIPSFRDYEVAGFPNFTITPTLSTERLSQAPFNMKSAKSIKSSNLLHRGISVNREDDANNAHHPAKHLSQPAQIFQPSKSAPMLFGFQQKCESVLESRTHKARASIPPKINSKPSLNKKQEIANPLLQSMDKDIKVLHDAFTNSLTEGSFLNDDILSGNALEDIAFDLSSQEIKQADPLQCMIYDDPVLPSMSTLDDDLLLALASDDDWAIGEGLDMDMS